MTPGIPGTGIGGLFYILSAMCMPFCELHRALRGRSRTAFWVVARQFAIAFNILALVSVGLWLLLPDPAATAVAGDASLSPAGAAGGALRLLFLFGTTGTLIAVLGLVQLLRLVIGKPRVP